MEKMKCLICGKEIPFKDCKTRATIVVFYYQENGESSAKTYDICLTHFPNKANPQIEISRIIKKNLI